MAATVIAGSAIALGFPSATVSADPGHCGVSVSSGGDTGTGVFSFVYLMRNDCSVGANFRVYQYTIGRDAQAGNGATCKWVNAHDTASFWDPVGDRTWQPLSC
ncbi:hypothetical protein AB0M22_38765 [Nocardia sp. NPDC051756]|uniref:hypothetical protein n=1 Tax=Nocardia sp. NPDC051756 TaxID=3154751 RepID=UPI00343535C1